MPGRAKRDPSLGPLQITVGGMVAIGEGDDVVALRDLARPMVALYVGGMGAKGRNFYNDVVRRYGYEEEAEKIQDLYLEGRKAEAEALVPDDLLESMSLCGPESYVAERIATFKEAGVSHLQVVPVPTGDQTAGRRHRQGQGAGRLTGSGPTRAVTRRRRGPPGSSSTVSSASRASSCWAICSISSAS